MDSHPDLLHLATGDSGQVRMKEPVLDEPIIVLTGGRSGSTLLRLIIDAHPDLACPAETNIVKTCSQLASAWAITGGFSINDLPDVAEEGIRAAVAALFGNYLTRCGKLRWCDKSLGTAPLAAWFTRLYPKAKFICLYRHCMDVIYSGLEASPWGLMGYGFEQFAGTRNGNNVSALAAYWIEHTGRIREFERENNDRCIRVYYERLAENPERVAEEVFHFLGVQHVPGITAGRLVTDAAAAGPGDHKIRATSTITADSVGRGVRIPAEMILPAQLKVINHLLADLEYTQVDEEWRTSACPPLLLKNGTVEDQLAGDAGQPLISVDDTLIRSVLEKIDTVVRTRITTAFRQALPSVDRDGLGGCRTFELVAYAPDGQRLVRSWRVDLEGRSVVPVDVGASDRFRADWMVTGDVETWLGVLAGRANMAACLRSGALRYIGPRDRDQQAGEAREPDLLLAARTENQLTVIREMLGLTASAQRGHMS